MPAKSPGQLWKVPSRHGSELGGERVLYLKELTIASKSTQSAIAGKLVQGPVYSLLAGGQLFVRLFEIVKLLSLAPSKTWGAARATRGV